MAFFVTKGRCRPKVTDKQYYLLSTIAPDGHESLLGDKASEDHGLINRVYHNNSAHITLDTQSQEINYTQCKESTDTVK